MEVKDTSGVTSMDTTGVSDMTGDSVSVEMTCVDNGAAVSVTISSVAVTVTSCAVDTNARDATATTKNKWKDFMLI